MANEVTQENVTTGETITRDYTQEEKDAIASYPSNTTEKKWERVRRHRDILLARCDWWASSDLTMSDAQTAYRKALRDLPASESNPDNIVFPDRP